MNYGICDECSIELTYRNVARDNKNKPIKGFCSHCWESY